MFGTEEGPGISTMPDDFNPFDIFEQFSQEFGGGIGGQHRRNGGTRFSFNNGNGSFTVFSSGFGSPFFEDDDNYVNPFEDIFFGRSRTTNRERNSRNNRSSQGNRNQRSNRTNREEMRKQMESSMKNAALCIQFFPLICFLFTFIIIPWILRNIF